MGGGIPRRASRAAAGAGSRDSEDRVTTAGGESSPPSTTAASPRTAPVLRLTTTTGATTTNCRGDDHHGAAAGWYGTLDARPCRPRADVGDGWSVAVVGKTPNATAAVLAENQFNDPPKTGEQFYIVRAKLRRTAATPESPGFALNWKAVGASNVGYAEGSDDSCWRHSRRSVHQRPVPRR